MTTWSPTSLFIRRAYGPENLNPVPQKDFCNTICQQRKWSGLFDDLVGNQQKVAANCQTKRSSRLQIYD